VHRDPPPPGTWPRGAALREALRRACCHPRLVAPDSEAPGAELEAFAEPLEELRQNRHKAQVFSQFVDLAGDLAETILDGTEAPGRVPVEALREG